MGRENATNGDEIEMLASATFGFGKFDQLIS
jgi:hypothetical protein